DMKRLFVVDRDRGNEADAPCRRSNCRREQGRVEHRASRVSVGKSVIEGNEIEQPGLGRLRHFDPRVRVLYVGIALVRDAVHTKCNMKAIGRVHLALLDWRTGAPGGRGASGRTQLKPIWQRSTFARAPSRYDMTWTLAALRTVNSGSLPLSRRFRMLNCCAPSSSFSQNHPAKISACERACLAVDTGEDSAGSTFRLTKRRRFVAMNGQARGRHGAVTHRRGRLLATGRRSSRPLESADESLESDPAPIDPMAGDQPIGNVHHLDQIDLVPVRRFARILPGQLPPVGKERRRPIPAAEVLLELAKRGIEAQPNLSFALENADSPVRHGRQN